MKKRSRQSHTGSCYQSGDWWYSSMMIDGKRRRLKSKTKAEATRKLKQLIAERDTLSRFAVITLEALSAKWLEHIRDTKSAKTLIIYSDAVRRFDDLKPIPVDKLQPQAVQACIDCLSGRTAQLAHDKFKQMLRAGIKWRLVSPGIDLLTAMERPQHEAEKAFPFTASEVVALLAHGNGERYEPAIRLAFTTGLRGGELWGLQWSDWDQSAATLKVDRQVVETEGHIEIKPPKKNSYRVILLGSMAMAALQDREARMTVEGLEDCLWIFPQPNGSPTHRSNFAHRAWQPLLKAVDLKHRGFHHARHTYATLSLNNGVPLSVVSQSLGHKRISTTLDTYAHCMTHEREMHRGAVDGLLSKS